MTPYRPVAAINSAIEPKTLAKDTLDRMLAYSWPGNVRELVNLCMRLSVLAPGNEIQVEDLPSELVTGEAGGSMDSDWARSLRNWADRAAMTGNVPLLDSGLDSLCFAIIVSRLETGLDVDPFSENEDTPFPVNLGEFIRFYENAVQ